MTRSFTFFLALAAFAAAASCSQRSYAQARDPRTGAVRSNNISPLKPDLVKNKIMMPIPLSASEQEKALAAIDRHVADEIGQLKTRLKEVLPDELTILTMTNGWRRRGSKYVGLGTPQRRPHGDL